MIERLTQIKGFCSSNSIDKLTALEQSISLEAIDFNHIGHTFLNACNTICNQTNDDLMNQQRVVAGPITQAVIQILQTTNEGSQYRETFIYAGVWIQNLLEPWLPNDEDHMKIKKEIATTLYELKAFDCVLSQMEFWFVEWKGCYGDGGRPIFLSLFYFLRLLPNLKDIVKANASVMAFIKQFAERERNRDATNVFSFGNETKFETDGTVSDKMATYLESVNNTNLQLIGEVMN